MFRILINAEAARRQRQLKKAEKRAKRRRETERFADRQKLVKAATEAQTRGHS